MNNSSMGVLLLDIETSPNKAFVWGLWDQNIGTNQIIDSSEVMCWSAKWLGEKEVMFDATWKSGKKRMLRRIRDLINEADVVVHYNGKKFDIPVLNRAFLLQKMAPPSPYKQVDLLKVSRSEFKFQSHKLDFVSKTLGHGGKVKHEGFQLWVDCMNGVPEAHRKMEKYNKGDVEQLEKVYYDFRPWIKNHPNHGLYSGTAVCTHCGSSNYQARGLARTKSVTYQRYQCKACGGWFKGEKHEVHQKPTFTEIA